MHTNIDKDKLAIQCEFKINLHSIFHKINIHSIYTQSFPTKTVSNLLLIMMKIYILTCGHL